MIKRQAVESIERQKIQMIAALYANTNWDDEKNDRNKRIEELERHFKNAIELVYDPDKNKQEIDWSNPFWSAAKRSYDRKLEKIRGERSTATVSEVIGADADHVKARSEARRTIDQM